MAGELMPLAFKFIGRDGEPVRIEIRTGDGRILYMQPTGEVSRGEARDICGAVMGALKVSVENFTAQDQADALPDALNEGSKR